MAAQTALRTFEFTLTLAGEHEMTDELHSALFKQGFAVDGSLCSERQTIFLMFHREAPDLGDAIASTVRAVEKAGYSVAHIEVNRPM